MKFERQALAGAIAALAARGVYVGTSSWKYPGWLGQIYSEDRYIWRRRVSKARFEKACLEEYAEVFKTVCVDAGYYRFPSKAVIEGLMGQVPSDFLFSFKVTDEITLKHFSKLPRFGDRAGKENPHFLDAGLFRSAFLAPLQSFRNQVGMLIFEFSRFYPRDFQRGRDFVDCLDRFLSELPADWPYGVEVRNPHLLHSNYFAMLERHRVSHVFNQWQRMPSVREQMVLPGALPAGVPVAARFLLTPGRTYQEAVSRFSPYEQLQHVDEDAREAGVGLIQKAIASGSAKPSVIYVNNRLEGNALLTIMAVLERLGMLQSAT